MFSFSYCCYICVIFRTVFGRTYYHPIIRPVTKFDDGGTIYNFKMNESCWFARHPVSRFVARPCCRFCCRRRRAEEEENDDAERRSKAIIPPVLIILIKTKPYEIWYTPSHVGVAGTNRIECQRNYIIRYFGLRDFPPRLLRITILMSLNCVFIVRTFCTTVQI